MSEVERKEPCPRCGQLVFRSIATKRFRHHSLPGKRDLCATGGKTK